MKATTQVTLRIPNELVVLLDKEMERLHFSNRNDVVRLAITKGLRLMKMEELVELDHDAAKAANAERDSHDN